MCNPRECVADADAAKPSAMGLGSWRSTVARVFRVNRDRAAIERRRLAFGGSSTGLDTQMEDSMSVKSVSEVATLELGGFIN